MYKIRRYKTLCDLITRKYSSTEINMEPVHKHKVLIVASGLSAFEIEDYPYKENEWWIVAVNHGWKVSNDWDEVIHSHSVRDLPQNAGNRLVTPEYGRILNEFGGHKGCGYSMTLSAAYFSLRMHTPMVMGFLGCDMNYEPDEQGRTCIYGVGEDIKRTGISDPDKMVNSYGRNDKNFLENIYMRFVEEANRHPYKCSVYNFSSEEKTRLPYEKKQVKELDAEFFELYKLKKAQ